MTVNAPALKLFWGLLHSTASNKGCPITIYLSDTLTVWNKALISFSVASDFPDDNSYILKL